MLIYKFLVCLCFINILHAEDLKLLMKDFSIQTEQFGKLEQISAISRTDSRSKRVYSEKIYSNEKFKAVAEMIENVEADYALSLIKLYRTEMLGAYRNRRSPYTGESLASIPCSPENIPTINPVNYYSKEADVLLLNASERNVFGVCQDSLIQKKTIVFLGYHPQKKIFVSLKIFIPRNVYKKEMLDNFLRQFKDKLPL